MLLAPSFSLSDLGTGKEGKARLARGRKHGWAPEVRDWILPLPDKTGDCRCQIRLGFLHGPLMLSATAWLKASYLEVPFFRGQPVQLTGEELRWNWREAGQEDYSCPAWVGFWVMVMWLGEALSRPGSKSQNVPPPGSLSGLRGNKGNRAWQPSISWPRTLLACSMQTHLATLVYQEQKENIHCSPGSNFVQLSGIPRK